LHEGREGVSAEASNSGEKAVWVPRYVILDCPPTLNVITTNALVASDSLLIPVQAEFYALEGLTELLRTFSAVRKRFNPGLMIEGMLLTMFDSRTRLASEVESELRKHYGDRVFRTVVPRSVRFGEAPSHGMTILDYDPGGRGAAAYVSLAKEVLAHESKRAWSRSFVAARGRRSGPVVEPAVTRGRGLSEDFLRRD
jgi:cellulose biosynthesis protein BcsQ